MAAMTKPALLFNRDEEWGQLSEFASADLDGLRLGVLYGRRRQGKSEILYQLAGTVGGLYSLALEQESRPLAIQRFADGLAEWVGLPRGMTFATWEEALGTAVRLAGERATAAGSPQLIVIDEFPFLLSHSPELPGVVQALYETYGPTRGRRHPPVRLILCGSALSIMSKLLAETQALYGRAMLNLCLTAFDHVAAARFWGIADPETAFRMHAVVGGIPGYRELTAAASVPQEPSDLDDWLAATVFNPAHALFDEVDLLFSQEPGIKDRAMYYGILAAVAAGESTPAGIAGKLGRDARTISYPLRVLRRAGFLAHDQDMLMNRRPIFSIADPVIRFHHVITIPRLQLFQRRGLAQRAWAEAQPAFTSQVLGPHFEQLAREWTITDLGGKFGVEIGWTGTTAVTCRAHGVSHQVDVVTLVPGATPRSSSAHIALLGEAKATNKPRGNADVARLRHIRELLGTRAASARLALFSRGGFERDLHRDRVIAVDLAAMYDH